MEIRFSHDSNRDIDRFVAVAQQHMVSHLEGATLYVTTFRPDEDEEAHEPWQDEGDVLDLVAASPSPFSPLPRATPLPLIAVDSGVQELGTLSGGGVAVAVRAAAVLYRGEERPLVFSYNTGGLVVDAGNRLPLFHWVGARLGNPRLWVDVQDPLINLTEKTPLRSNEVRNACRSFVERMVTEEAIGVLATLGGGTLLLDGALPPQSFDLPNVYIVDMLGACARNGVDVVALSKKTRHTVQGCPIGSLFDDEPGFVGYAPIRGDVDSLRAQQAHKGNWRDISAAAEVYAARFSMGPTALTFRVDVHNSQCCTPSEVLERVYTDIPLYGGYPTALIQAHQYSSFLGVDTAALAADLVARYGFRFETERTMDVLFQPFNPFGK